MDRIVRTLAVAVAIALFAVLPAALAQTPESEEKLTLRMGMTNEIDSLNPFKLLEIPSYEYVAINYNYLVEPSAEDLTPSPGLADSWETSEDGLEWTFHLNPDATWHDGEPVTSEDVRYTFQRVLDEKQGVFIDYVGHVTAMETPDEHTIVFRSKEPSVQMLSMYVPILPKHIWEDVPEDESKSFANEPAIGSGPFQAMEWRKGQFVRLEANPDYFRGAPQIDEVIFQFYDNPDTMVQALQRGEVDHIWNPPVNLFKSLEGEENIETVSAPDPGFTELGFNLYEPSPEAIEEFGAPKRTTGHPALLDVRVRQAINWAIDEQGLTDTILRGEGVPGSTVVPPLLSSYHLEVDESELMAFDIDRSKELLAEAGWEDTDGDGTVDKDGEDLELRLFARSENSESVKAAQFIEDWLGEAGVKVDTKALSDNALTDVIYDADFDMFIWGWGSDVDPDFILSVLHCGQWMGWSDTFYCNEDYSRMYDEQKQQLDPEERTETIKEMQRIAYEESPYVIFYYDNQFEAYRTDKFTGWTQLPANAETGQLLFTPSTATYLSLGPIGADDPGAASDEKGGGGSPLLWILVGVLIVAVVVMSIMLRRRASSEDRL
jgi:peptide/nickel transport system substrate-binding protein